MVPLLLGRQRIPRSSRANQAFRAVDNNKREKKNAHLKKEGKTDIQGYSLTYTYMSYFIHACTYTDRQTDPAFRIALG